MPGRARNTRLRKSLSLQVIRAWLELLDETGTRWVYWETPQQDLTSLFDKYRISECMGLTLPYAKSRTACETFLKTSERYLSQSDLDEDVWAWVNGDTAPPRMRVRLKAFLLQDQEGVKSLITEKSKNLLSMLDFLSSKQTLGETVLTAHDQFISTHLLAARVRDRIIREECTKAQGIDDIKKAMTDLRTLFEKCKSFLSKEPGQEAYDGATLTFGDNPFENTLDNLNDILIY